ncbi:polysaccharide biosynthesis/export family protein [Flavobacterium quisquiliarum]|uniref:Polysaccharide biosynthesis/export family protein n=1 Tax=Flavobacterium quisquiliarum TaxID=1834436 RepID=A0ABV8WE53_9FLAO|nr:polysaccharide biosynthesis/export family protein [Flavobacterium quisquiliarum]MBW1657675.1 sugar transporter [Flavobacterium quisquiliarum]NWL00131.1 sugar transporter [Flavobacterium collinsii]
MTQKSFYLFLLISVLLTSCIPIKDLVYLQDKSTSSEQNTISAVESKPYRLQVNDVLSINMKAIDPKLVSIFNTSNAENNQALRSEASLYFDGFKVDDHGNIRMPILGELNVIGYTLEEVRVKIEKKLLEEYFKSEANIFVTVKLAGFRYTINGEVGSTGTKTLFKDSVTILEAIANAGDITTVGNRKAVTVIRQAPTGVQMNDIDLTDVNVMKSPYYYLQPNDYIYVKPLRQKTWGTGQTGIQSIGTIITLLSLATTVYLIIKN